MKRKTAYIFIGVAIALAVCCVIVFLIALSSESAEDMLDKKEWIIRDAYPDMNGVMITREYSIPPDNDTYHYHFVWVQRPAGYKYSLTYDEPVDLMPETAHLVKYSDITYYKIMLMEKEDILKEYYPNMDGWFFDASFSLPPENERYHYEFYWHQSPEERNYKIIYDEVADLTIETAGLCHYAQINDRKKW